VNNESQSTLLIYIRVALLPNLLSYFHLVPSILRWFLRSGRRNGRTTYRRTEEWTDRLTDGIEWTDLPTDAWTDERTDGKGLFTNLNRDLFRLVSHLTKRTLSKAVRMQRCCHRPSSFKPCPRPWSNSIQIDKAIISQQANYGIMALIYFTGLSYHSWDVKGTIDRVKFTNASSLVLFSSVKSEKRAKKLAKLRRNAMFWKQ
jgi:hypothetical protein